jgi:hypothetical protein
LAEHTFAEGVYHDALLAIVDFHSQSWAQVAAHLQRFCHDIGVPIGDTSWALQYLLDHHITRMAQPGSDPDGELVALMHAVGPKTLEHIYQDQHTLGLDRILFLGMQFNYFMQFPDVPADERESARQASIGLIPEMRDAANDWLKRHGTRRDKETSP